MKMKKIIGLCVLAVGMRAFAMEESNGNIDISGLDKVVLLKALYERAKPLGSGFLQYTPAPLSDEVAEKASKKYIDYLNGRVMKINISGDEVNTRLYNRDNGASAAEEVIQNIKDKKS